jgi:Na+-transporting NADH:ubiquinone oxidoreductase subunit NqrD
MVIMIIIIIIIIIVTVILDAFTIKISKNVSPL